MKKTIPVELTRPFAPDTSIAELFDGLGLAVVDFLRGLNVALEDLEDETHNTFVALMSASKGGYRSGPVSPKSYVFGFAKKFAIKNYHRRTAAFARHADEEQGALLSDEKTSPSRRLMRSQVFEQIVQTLDPIHRSCFVMYEYLDFEPAEIAEIEGVAVGTIHSRLHRARKAVDKALQVGDARERWAALQRKKESA